jgi:hypothetical protein
MYGYGNGYSTRSYIHTNTSVSAPIDVDVTDTLDARFYSISNTSGRESAIGTVTFDGQGGGSFSETYGSNSEGGNIAISGSTTYTVSSYGTVSCSSNPDWKYGLQKGGRMFVGVRIYTTQGNQQSISVAYRKAGSHALSNVNRFFATFHKGNRGSFGQFGQSTTSDSGVVSSYYTSNAPGEISTSLSITGRVAIDQDGRYAITYPSILGGFKDISYTYKGAVRDDGEFVSQVKVDNQIRNMQRITFGITKSASPMSNASVNGTYFYSRYAQHGSSGSRDSEFGTVTCDGAGNFSGSSTSSDSTAGGNQSNTFSGTYSVASDGSAQFTTTSGTTPTITMGVVNAEGDIFIGADINDNSDQSIVISVKAK